MMIALRAAVGMTATLALAACVAAAEPPSDPTPRVVYVTATPGEAATPSPTPTLAPGFAPAPTRSGPRFAREIVFATEPDLALAARNFARKTPRVYALWRYADMQPNLRVRRVWLQNGQLYLERESDWDFKKYGADGLMADTSIFDFANGLPNGHYELQLYIDGQPQFSEEDAPFRSFDLGVATTYPGLSPDSRYLAREDSRGTLIVADAAGRRREIARANAIAGFDWLPDSQRLIYAIRRGSRFDLWIVNVETGESIQLNFEGESLSQPSVSPDGKRVAALSGLGAVGDSCAPAYGLAVFELDRVSLARSNTLTLDDWRDLPIPNGASEPEALALGEPLAWKSPTTLEAPLTWTCAENPPKGVYRLDALTLAAERVGDLPSP